MKKAGDALKPVLTAAEDARAAVALAQVKKSKPDLDAVRLLITSTSASLPPAWEQARQLGVPEAEEAEAKCTALRSAALAEQEEVARSDTLAADRGRLVDSRLKFHDRHGDQPCPVYGQGALDADWAVAARPALERDQSAARDLTAARAETAQAR